MEQLARGYYSDCVPTPRLHNSHAMHTHMQCTPHPAYYTETLKFNKKYKMRVAGDSSVRRGRCQSSLCAPVLL